MITKTTAKPTGSDASASAGGQDTPGVSERITQEVTSWPGVAAGFGRRGEWGFSLGGRALGHLHGDHAAHFGFPKAIWRELYEGWRIDFHPVFPGREGWAARRIESDADVDDVIAMLRLNYDRAIERHGLPEGIV